MPHPNFGPRRPISSLRAKSNGVSGSSSRVCKRPFTVREILLMAISQVLELKCNRKAISLILDAYAGRRKAGDQGEQFSALMTLWRRVADDFRTFALPSPSNSMQRILAHPIL